MGSIHLETDTIPAFSLKKNILACPKFSKRDKIYVSDNVLLQPFFKFNISLTNNTFYKTKKIPNMTT